MYFAIRHNIFPRFRLYLQRNTQTHIFYAFVRYRNRVYLRKMSTRNVSKKKKTRTDYAVVPILGISTEIISRLAPLVDILKLVFGLPLRVRRNRQRRTALGSGKLVSRFKRTGCEFRNLSVSDGNDPVTKNKNKINKNKIGPESKSRVAGGQDDSSSIYNADSQKTGKNGKN